MTADVVKQIRRATRRRFTAEQKIRIVLEVTRPIYCTSPSERVYMTEGPRISVPRSG